MQGRLMVVKDDVRMMIRDGVSACVSRRTSERATDERNQGNRTERCFAG